MKTPFGGKKSEQYNAIYNAIIECGNDNAEMLGEPKDDNACYVWLDKIPKTSLTVELVDKLNELGFEIIKS